MSSYLWSLIAIWTAWGVAFGAACAFIARKKERNLVGFFFLGFFLGIFGLLIAAFMSRADPAAYPGEGAGCYYISGDEVEGGRLVVSSTSVEFFRGRDQGFYVPLGDILGVAVRSGESVPEELPSRETMLRRGYGVLQVRHSRRSGVSEATLSFWCQARSLADLRISIYAAIDDHKREERKGHRGGVT